MFCPHCGSNLPDGTQFCSNCGNPINLQNNAGAQQAQPQQQAQTPPPPNYNTAAPVPANQTYANQNQGYGNPNPTNMTSGPLRTDRDIIMYILLSIVTCGIYGYWYIYQMALDANAICAGDNEETPGLLIFILLSIVTCGIYSLYWMYKLANRLQANGPRYGIAVQEGGSDVLLWLVLGIFTCNICSYIAMNIILKNMNTLSVAYNQANGYA